MTGKGRGGMVGVWGGIVLSLATAWAPAAAGQAPPQDLAQLVPPTAVVLVRATDLGGLWKEAKESAFVQRLKATQVWQKLVTSDDYLKMVNARNVLMERHQVDVEQVLLDTVGREVILVQALEAKPDGGQQAFFYLLAARAASADRLKAIADKLRAVRADTGELKSSVEHPYRGHVIYEEVTVAQHGRQAGREKTSYYCLAGEVLLAGERVGPVKAAIDRLLDPGTPSLAGSKRYQEALGMLPAGCAATVYVDVAALTAAKEPAGELPGGGKRPALGGLLGRMRGLMKAVDTLALGLRRGEAMQVLVRARVNAEQLEPAVAELLRGRAAAHEAWAALPTGTVAALTVRTDVPALMGFVRGHLLGPQAAQRFDGIKQRLSVSFGGLDFDKEVLPKLGPEIVLALTRQPVPTTPGDGKTPRGVAATFLIQTRPEGDIGARFLSALGAFAATVVTGNNRNPEKPKLVVDVERVRGVSVTYIDFAGDHPWKGTFSPCCAKVGSFVALSTSRKALRDLVEASTGGTSLAEAPAFRRHLQLFGGKADAVLYLDARQLAAALQDNREVLVAGRKAGKTEEQARAELSALIELIGLVEAVSVARSHSPERVSATLTVTAAPAAPR